MTTTEAAPGHTGSDHLGRPVLPDNPFLALHYHFGMLLGVDDFETEQGFHHGKMRLHNAWLHRDGVVWGLGVEADPEAGELRVDRGLALDAAGHELYLDRALCVDVAAWFEENEHAVDTYPAGIDDDDDAVSFEARVEISYRPCLTRPVPALSEPCSTGDDAGDATAFSRVLEGIEVCLVPVGVADRVVPYHRLRLLFGLEEPREDEEGNVVESDQEVLDERQRIAGLAPELRPPACLAAFRAFAALDVAEMSPGIDDRGNPLPLLPAADPAPVVLASVNVTLEGPEGHRTLREADVDIRVRPSHVATATIQELLCRACVGDSGTGTGPGTPGVPAPTPDPPTPPDACHGPRVSRVELGAGNTVVVTTDRPLAKKSVSKDAFTVSEYTEAKGWDNRRVARARLDPTGTAVTLTLDAPAGGQVVRVVSSGSGRWPLLGKDLEPLDGSTGDPPGPRGGHDSVYHLEGSP